MQTWSDHLRRYRRAHALTQAALAEHLGVEQATVSRWERGTHQPELGIQRRLRDLMRCVPSRTDQLVFHRVECALSAMKIANRNAQNMAASPAAARLHGAPKNVLSSYNYRPLFTEILETQWCDAITLGFFSGEIASIRVYNAWKPIGGRDVRYCVSYWTPLHLSDGETVLLSDFAEIPSKQFAQIDASQRFTFTSMDELVKGA